MKNGILIFLLIINAFTCFGQKESVIVEGKVVDSIRKKPLAYVNIYTDNYQGTISNSEGEFTLKVDSATKFVTISFLGYRKKEYAITAIPQKIELHPIPFELKQIVIKPIDVNKFVQQLIDKYKHLIKQKSQEPASFFYRQITVTDTTCNEIMEAFFNAGSLINVHNLDLQTGRYAELKSDSVNHYFTFTNFFTFSQVTPFHKKKLKKKTVIVPLLSGFQKYYKFSIDILQNAENGVLTYKLNFVPLKGVNKPMLQGSLFIDPTNLSFLKLEGKIRNIPLKLSNKGTVVKNNVIHFTVQYDTSKSVPIVKTVNIINSFTTLYQAKKLKVEIHIHSILYNVGGKHQLNNNIKVKSKSFLLNKIVHSQYDSSFWSQNPIIRRTPLERNAIKIFEKKNLFGTYQEKQK